MCTAAEEDALRLRCEGCHAFVDAVYMQLSTDFIERERKELERFQKQLPGEVKKIRAFMTEQRRELK